MRIITGIFKGRRFDIPRTFKARPTTDFAKENLFNVLKGYIDFDERPAALDLFAGTGSITFELLSRGCSRVVCVEKDAQHYMFIMQCLETLGCAGCSASSACSNISYVSDARVMDTQHSRTVNSSNVSYVSDDAVALDNFCPVATHDPLGGQTQDPVSPDGFFPVATPVNGDNCAPVSPDDFFPVAIPLRADVFAFLSRCKQNFDLIFADPPYALPNLSELPDIVLGRGLLKRDGIFVLEHGKSNDFSSHPSLIDHRQYGSVNFSFFRI